MTFRITRLDDAQGPVLKVDGWLQAEGLPDLEREIGRVWVAGPAGLGLDLGGLRQADDASLWLLRRLLLGGARLIDCPPYLALRLSSAAGPQGHEAPGPAADRGA